MRRIFAFLVILVLCALSEQLFCQEKKGLEYDIISEAGIDAVIYRGPVYVKYPFRFSGTFYAYSPNFGTGSVYYNNKEYNNVKINLNSHRDELHLQMYGAGLIIVLEKSYVERFSYGGCNFTNHTEGDGIVGLQPGYYQVLYSGEIKLFKRIEQLITEKLGVDSRGMSTLKEFSPRYTYFLIKDGEAVQIKKRGDIIKNYKPMKGQIKQFVRENQLNLADKSENDKVFGRMIEFIDNK